MEDRYFFVPRAGEECELPEDEAVHALKVLRLKEGDEVVLIDGVGTFHRALLTIVTKKSCEYAIVESIPQTKGWRGSLHLAIAPTKNFDRMEWLVEKCTEIGFDALTFLHCRNSERHKVRMERINKVVAAAMKQSRKPFMPILTELTDFQHFIAQPIEGKKFICHCYEEIERTELLDELNALESDEKVTILVGPEGDFAIEEVWQAMNKGFQPVTLGTFRLRTETAGVMAVSAYNLVQHLKDKT